MVLSLVANSAWTITSEQDWIKADPAEGGITSAEGVEVVVGIDENPVTDDRTGAFTIKCGTAEKTISVTQRGAGLFLEVENSDKTQMFTDAGGEISFTVNTNGTLTAKADASWITASVENGNTVKISVGSNAGEKNRPARLPLPPHRKVWRASLSRLP
ncbi:MAG: BACON domain-containing protein [Alistipes putredinis]|nr:MAG: BACON domain-containing protein [Alistipes putredinis]